MKINKIYKLKKMKMLKWDIYIRELLELKALELDRQYYVVFNYIEFKRNYYENL